MAQLLPPDLAALGRIRAFQGLPLPVLAWLQQAGELWQYAPGETVVHPDEHTDRMLAVVTGGIQYDGPAGEQFTHLVRLNAGCLGGALPYARFQHSAGLGVAVGETVVYVLLCSLFPALEQASPELVQRLVGVLSDRARDEVRAQERDDKLRALGKLSAGLSHELNNPAAAISRASASLKASLRVLPSLLLRLLATAPPAEAMANVTALAMLPDELPPPLTALQAADREAELADWLEAQGCPDGYALAAGLLDAGFTVATLAGVATQLPAGARGPAFAWLSGHLTAQCLARDISEAGQRISTLVNDVKIYSHMDRATGPEKLAVTSGMDSTLHMFAHALRQKNVALTRDYAPDLPLITGQAGSLNQVWTNLLDNALDALPAAGGELRVCVRQVGNFLCISIQDNGAGITPEVLAHMFEPFYTTKAVGKGSGQGLDIARHIVQEHNGRLEATSEPGRTEFRVFLPRA
jgi:signal transduction histidine kinase